MCRRFPCVLETRKEINVVLSLSMLCPFVQQSVVACLASTPNFIRLSIILVSQSKLHLTDFIAYYYHTEKAVSGNIKLLFSRKRRRAVLMEYTYSKADAVR